MNKKYNYGKDNDLHEEGFVADLVDSFKDAAFKTPFSQFDRKVTGFITGLTSDLMKFMNKAAEDILYAAVDKMSQNMGGTIGNRKVKRELVANTIMKNSGLKKEVAQIQAAMGTVAPDAFSWGTISLLLDKEIYNVNKATKTFARTFKKVMNMTEKEYFNLIAALPEKVNSAGGGGWFLNKTQLAAFTNELANVSATDKLGRINERIIKTVSKTYAKEYIRLKKINTGKDVDDPDPNMDEDENINADEALNSLLSSKIDIILSKIAYSALYALSDPKSFYIERIQQMALASYKSAKESVSNTGKTKPGADNKVVTGSDSSEGEIDNE
jgi:hypothetical protein